MQVIKRWIFSFRYTRRGQTIHWEQDKEAPQ